ncbi:HNH endonuclease [Mumia sp. zg.B21]|uniref:HNH endonuclease n=1 Tax=Mumia sp. zg.B21 TaxID=2855447 RepID=UPI001C6E1924|nr:HNH endonuclease signature motif containing protein [Mumia sp. zg.B21]MBW9210106.1 HNH endonuclease [Mumia sp. zg.B21]
MGKHQFTNAERYAVYETHGARCYICTRPVDLMSMHVDHVIPVHLGDEPTALAAAIEELGIPDDFDANSFANWLPACSPCNFRKSKSVRKRSLQVQLMLQRAEERASRAAAAVVSKQKLSNAINTVLRVLEGDGPTGEQLAAIEAIAKRYQEHLAPEAERDEVLHVTPTVSVLLYEVLSDDGVTRIVRGAYGVGGGPSSPSPGMTCTCG